MKVIGITVLIGFVILGCVLFVRGKNYCRDCNVILISIDTLRADHLSMYGYNKNTSPNLDKYAKDAIVFENFYSTAPWTLPAHASMFASDYPSKLRVESIFDKVPDSVLTITEILKKNGYYTYGFDSDSYVSPRWNFQQGFDRYVIENADPKSGTDISVIFSHAQDWLNENKKRKFFLFIHTMEPHDPYCPPQYYTDEFKNEYKGKLDCIDWRTISGVNTGNLKLEKGDLERFKSLYDGEISYTDYYLGEFFKKLNELGLDKKTIVIITSDHGEEFGERGAWGKHASTLYNEQLRIPLVIKAPNLEKGKEKGKFSTIDISPSILDLLGIEKPMQYKGVSIRTEPRNRILFFELGNTKMKNLLEFTARHGLLPNVEPHERKNLNTEREKVGLVSGKWKLIRTFHPAMVELYNLEQDPLEKTNLAFANDGKVRELESYLIEQFELKEHADLQKIEKNINQNDLNRLRSVGY